MQADVTCLLVPCVGMMLVHFLSALYATGALGAADIAVYPAKYCTCSPCLFGGGGKGDISQHPHTHPSTPRSSALHIHWFIYNIGYKPLLNRVHLGSTAVVCSCAGHLFGLGLLLRANLYTTVFMDRGLDLRPVLKSRLIPWRIRRQSLGHAVVSYVKLM